jgi:dsDNA-specific endonuclease/ATPase MutS2
MNDKDRLEHIKKKVSDLRLLGDSEGNGEVNVMAIHNDMMWLIEQAEKVEQLEQENEKLKWHNQNLMNSGYEYTFELEKKLQQAQEKIEQCEKRLKHLIEESKWGNVETALKRVVNIAKQAIEDLKG